MANITFKGNDISTAGQLPSVGSTAADFTFVMNDLSESTLYKTEGKFKILNIFPSIDTGVCATSVRQFNQRAATRSDVKVLCVSKDLPFAQKRFCGAEGIERVETVSVFKSDFSKTYALDMISGPLSGLCSRAIVVLDANNKVLYTEQVSDIVNEPNYDAALKVIS